VFTGEGTGLYTSALALELEPPAEFDIYTGTPMNRSARQDVRHKWAVGGEGSVRAVPYAELEAATAGFSEQSKIGGGGSCIVYQGDLYHVQVAVKRLKHVAPDDDVTVSESGDKGAGGGSGAKSGAPASRSLEKAAAWDAKQFATEVSCIPCVI
jgi:hypothetical protein